MERTFTKSLGRWAKGQSADYPMDTWRKLEENTGESMGDFSVLTTEAATQGVNRKGARNAA
jgi:hypothetical protein